MSVAVFTEVIVESYVCEKMWRGRASSKRCLCDCAVMLCFNCVIFSDGA